VSIFTEASLDVGGEVVVETMRASGPGGQHVNKTESAVRVTHVQTGISVKIAGSRSQRQNKDNAMRVLGLKLREAEGLQRAESKQQKRDRHTSKASGIVKRRFVGDKFTES
jgi:peptide chain release factor